MALIARSLETAIHNLWKSLSCLGMKTDRRKTSFEVDFAKVERAKKLLGTTTLTDTVDAALDQVIAQQRRSDLVTLLFENKGVELANPEVMADAWR